MSVHRQVFPILAALLPLAAQAQTADVVLPDGWDADPPVLGSLVAFAERESDLRVAIIRYLEDKAAVERRYEVLFSPVRQARLQEFYDGWQGQLEALDFAGLNKEGQIDYIALRNRIRYDIEMPDVGARAGANRSNRCYRSPTTCALCRKSATIGNA